MSKRPQVLAIVGLTGTGKSELACRVARRIDAELISADSMQVYRGMDIGTAKPSPALRREIPHHGIDLVDPDGEMSAGRFAAFARRAAQEILGRGRQVILCGGTGLYARAFAGGLVPGIPSDPRVRDELRALDRRQLRALLEASDPAGARRIHPHDRVRMERALEVHRLTGKPLSDGQARHRFQDRPFEVRWMGLTMERERLWERLRGRVDRMFEAGLVEEVRALHREGYGPELRPLRSIGYREVGELLAGRMGETDAREAIFHATRRYARRQRTWFRSETGLIWADAADPDRALDAALRRLEGGPTG